MMIRVFCIYSICLFLLSDFSLSQTDDEILFLNDYPDGTFLIAKSDIPQEFFTNSAESFVMNLPDGTIYFSIHSSLAMNDPLYKADSAKIKRKSRGHIIWQPFDAGTMAVQVVGSAVGLVVGGLICSRIYNIIYSPSGFEGGLATLAIGVFGGLAIGIPVGICATGSMMGGNGSLGLTLLSGIVGTGIFYGTYSDATDSYLYFLPITNFVLPLVTYHLTAKPVYQKVSSNPMMNTDNYAFLRANNINIMRFELLSLNF